MIRFSNKRIRPRKAHDHEELSVEEDVVYGSDDALDSVVAIADEMVEDAISEEYDRELAKEALDYSVGDLAQAASYLLDRGMSEAGLARFAEAALADIELTEDPRYGEYIRPSIVLRPTPDSPAEETAPIIDIAENGLPISSVPVPVFAYDFELAKQALDAGGGDLGRAAEFLMGRGFGPADLEMFAAQALADEALLNDATYGALLAPPPMAPIGSDAFGNPLPGNPAYGAMPGLPPADEIESYYDSRFASEEEAIAYAEANGQGALTVAADGTITNQNGEVMVYDSDGNLAPAAIGNLGLNGDPGNPNPMPVYGDPSNPNQGVDPTDRDQVFDSRFGTEEDAIAYAEASGQGPLTKLADGSIINQYGEVMVSDSSGNLAPAPRDVPVGMVKGEDGQIVDDPNWSPEQAVADAMANAEIAAQVDAQAAADAAAAQAAADAAAAQAAADAAAARPLLMPQLN